MHILSKKTENPHIDTLWCPSILQNIDYVSFKQTPEQKSDAIAAKWQHKLFMKKHGIDGKKFLNIPINRLEKSIIITT